MIIHIQDQAKITNEEFTKIIRELNSRTLILPNQELQEVYDEAVTLTNQMVEKINEAVHEKNLKIHNQELLKSYQTTLTVEGCHGS